VIVEWDAFGTCFEIADIEREGRECALSEFPAFPRRVKGHHIVDLIGVVEGQVEAGTDADFEDAARGFGDEFLSLAGDGA
jgi:hypothetical protein